MDIDDAISRARDDLRAHADPVKAPGRKNYLKTDLDVLGCGVPDVRRAAKSVKRAVRNPQTPDLTRALDAVWPSTVHDDRLLVIFVAQQFNERFDASHVGGMFCDWIRDSHTWDVVDAICTFVVGHVAVAHPEAWREIARWTNDDWMWLRRASLLCHIPAIRADALRLDQLRESCAALIDEKEFFIRKAIGWTIRELSDADAKTAEKLILELGPRMSGLTYREATRKLPAAARTRIQKALAR